MSPQEERLESVAKQDPQMAEKIKAFRGELERSWNVGKLNSWSVFSLAEFLRTTLLPLLAKWGLDNIENLPLEFRQSIHDAVKSAYDKYVRPINIPVIIEPFETKLENKIWEYFCDWLCNILKLEHVPDFIATSEAEPETETSLEEMPRKA